MYKTYKTPLPLFAIRQAHALFIMSDTNVDFRQ